MWCPDKVGYQCPILCPDARLGPSSSQVPSPVTLGWHELIEKVEIPGPVPPKREVNGEMIQAQFHGHCGHCL